MKLLSATVVISLFISSAIASPGFFIVNRQVRKAPQVNRVYKQPPITETVDIPFTADVTDVVAAEDGEKGEGFNWWNRIVCICRQYDRPVQCRYESED